MYQEGNGVNKIEEGCHQGEMFNVHLSLEPIRIMIKMKEEVKKYIAEATRKYETEIVKYAVEKLQACKNDTFKYIEEKILKIEADTFQSTFKHTRSQKEAMRFLSQKAQFLASDSYDRCIRIFESKIIEYFLQRETEKVNNVGYKIQNVLEEVRKFEEKIIHGAAQKTIKQTTKMVTLADQEAL